MYYCAFFSQDDPVMISFNEIAQSYWKGDKSFILKDNLYSTVFIKIAQIPGQSMDYPKTIKQGM